MVDGYSNWSNGNTVDELIIENLQLGASGKYIKVIKYTATADDQTAGTVSIPIGFIVAGFVCSILRAGKDVTNKAAISGSTTNLVVATNGTDYVLTNGDVIQAFVWA